MSRYFNAPHQNKVHFEVEAYEICSTVLKNFPDLKFKPAAQRATLSPIAVL